VKWYDHYNGVEDDNRIVNLRFLCANCHQQTETWGVGASRKKGPPNPCIDCRSFAKTPAAKRCRACYKTHMENKRGNKRHKSISPAPMPCIECGAPTNSGSHARCFSCYQSHKHTIREVRYPDGYLEFLEAFILERDWKIEMAVSGCVHCRYPAP
jgi:hypothetical protein